MNNAVRHSCQLIGGDALRCKTLQNRVQRCTVIRRGDIFVVCAKVDVCQWPANTADLASHNFRQISAKQRHLDRARPCIDDKDHADGATIAPSAIEDNRAAEGSARDVNRIGTLAPITMPPAHPPVR